MSPSVESKLLKTLQDCSEDVAKQILMLIAEHARIDGVDFASPNAVLPYGGKKTKEGISFDIKKLPVELKWILHNFVKLSVVNTS